MASLVQRVTTRYKVAKTFLMKNPQLELKGEVIEVAKLHQYEEDVKRLAQEYKEQKVTLDRLPSGKAKGLAGRALAQIGAEGRRARARVEVAKAMKARNVSRAKF
jgi:hypothetical protein